MLGAIREGIKSGIGSWVIKGLLGLLIAAFALWGIGDMFRTAIATNVAVVDDVEIDANSFLTEFNRQVRLMRQQFGSDFDNQTALRMGVADTVINRMVSRTSLDIAARQLGLRVPDEKIRDSIRSDEAFQNDFGDFDDFRYNRVLGLLQMSEGQFVASRRGEIAREYLIDALLSGIKSPRTLAEALYRYRFETRDADYFVLADKDLPAIAGPDEETLIAYHKAHAARFQSPEYRGITYLTLRPADLAKDIEISEEDLKQAYEARASEFGVAEKRTIQQMVFNSEDEARAFYDKLRDGVFFEQAANEKDGSSLEDITLGDLDEDELAGLVGDDIAKTVFALKQDIPGAPVKSEFGTWHVFNVSNIHQGTTRSFASVRDKLATDLATEKATDELFEFANRIDDKLAEGASLEETAAALELPVNSIAALDRNGRDPQGTEVDGLVDRAAMLTYAFGHDIGEDPFLEETKSGAYFVIRVDTVTPAAEKPLDSVRADVVRAVKRDALKEAAKKRATELVGAARSSGNFAAVARGARTEVAKATGFQRNGIGAASQMSRDVIGRLFEARSGDYLIARTAADDGYLIAHLTAVTPGNPATDAAGLKSLQATLVQSIGNDIFAEYQTALNRQMDVRVNRSLMNSLFQSIPGGGSSLPQ